MIRFVDLRHAYWCWEQGDDPKCGPFAFLDTITDLFIEIDGEEMWHDRRSLREAFERDPKASPRPLERLLRMLPDDVPEDELATHGRRSDT